MLHLFSIAYIIENVYLLISLIQASFIVIFLFNLEEPLCVGIFFVSLSFKTMGYSFYTLPYAINQ